jgi:hypothetical protein
MREASGCHDHRVGFGSGRGCLAVRVLLLLAVAALMVVPDGSARLPSACALLTNAEVGAALGSTVVSREAQVSGSLYRGCVWRGAPLGAFTSAHAQVMLELAAMSRSQFSKAARRTHGVAVRGVGEAALWLDGPVEMLWVWARGVDLELQMSDVSSSQAAAEKLANAALARL